MKPHDSVELWQVETAGHVRSAHLFPHPDGFEIRIVDRQGMTVESQTFAAEPDAERFAEERRGSLLSGGMADSPASSV